MPGRGDAGGAMDVGADVAVLRDERCSRVQAHTQTDWASSDALVDATRGFQGCRRRGERNEEGVALRVDLDPILLRTSLPHNSPMLGEGARVRLCAELMQELRRALDIGEEEGHGAGREVVAHAARSSARRDSLLERLESLG